MRKIEKALLIIKEIKDKLDTITNMITLDLSKLKHYEYELESLEYWFDELKKEILGE